MHSPIIFIASKDYYDDSDSKKQRKLLGQDNVKEDVVFNLLNHSGCGMDYIDLDTQGRWKPEHVFEGDPFVDIVDENEDHSVATLRVNKKAYFEDFVRTVGEYHKIIEKRLKNDEITYGFGKEDSSADYKTIYDFREKTKPYGGVQFILDGDEAYNLEDLFGDYMEAEYYINLAYAGDYHY